MTAIQPGALRSALRSALRPALRRSPDAGADHGAFPALDGLRAVAVGAVVLTHAAYWTGRYERGWGGPFLARMDSGVAVFFVISGFLLLRPWLISAMAPGARRQSVRRYLWRRVLRIVPAYWLAVTLCLLLLPQNADATGWDWVRHALLLQTYHFGWIRDGLSQTWSLSTEVAFYAVLPLLAMAAAWWLRRSGRRGTAGLLAGCLGLGLVSMLWYRLLHAGVAPVMGAFWLPGYLSWFAAGMAMAVVRVQLDLRRPPPQSRWWYVEELGGRPFTCWSISAAALLLALTPLAGPRAIGAGSVGQEVTKNLLYAVLAASLAWPAVFGSSPITRALLGGRVMRYLGDISYGVFLLHLLVLESVMRLLGNRVFSGQVIQVFPLTLTGAVLLAALSFRFIERPFIRLGHRQRTDPAPGHGTASSDRPDAGVTEAKTAAATAARHNR